MVFISFLIFFSYFLFIFIYSSIFCRGTLLSEYNLAFKQLGSVWEDIDPVFQLYEIVPVKPTQQPAESKTNFILIILIFRLKINILVPSILCTSIPIEDSKAIIEPDLTLSSSHQEIETLVLYNQTMKRFITSYSEKAGQIVKPKRQKITHSKNQIPNDKIKQELSQYR